MSVRPVPASIREPLRHVLLERQESRLPWETARPASVLIPLVERAGEVHVWLIRRPDTMSTHPGQVAFPGGKRDGDDRDSMVTALRETHEELGFPSDLIEVHGRLDDVPTITNFIITPWIGWLKRDVPPTPNEHEVAHAFCAPLARFVWEKPKPQLFRGVGITRIVPSWIYEGEIVWGATAKIMQTFVTVVRDVMHRHQF